MAHDDSREAWRALDVAVAITRRTGGELTLVHVAPVEDEPLDLVDGLRDELLGRSPAARVRGRLACRALELGVRADVRVACGPIAATLLRLVEQDRPDVVVAGRRRGRRVSRALASAAPCPVVLVPTPAARRARVALPEWTRMRVLRHRTSLFLRLFVANALVLAVATLLLVVGPVSVSRDPVIAEALVLAIGLAVMLGVHLLLLRRMLAPLRALADVMGAIDLRVPGRRVDVPAGAVELTAVTDGFNAMLDRLEQERRESARRALAAQEEERLRIARELHDEIGQTLTALAIQAERAVELGHAEPATLRQLAGSAARGLEDVRRIGRELRPEALDDLGLGNALITLCRRLSGPAGVRVSHDLEPGLPALTAEAELVIYRIAQEGTTNAIRHAAATRIHVTLRAARDGVVLTVADDGRGLPDPLPLDSSGIGGMRERAMLIGAALTFATASDGGALVRLHVPVEENIE